MLPKCVGRHQNQSFRSYKLEVQSHKIYPIVLLLKFLEELFLLFGESTKQVQWAPMASWARERIEVQRAAQPLFPAAKELQRSSIQQNRSLLKVSFMVFCFMD